MKVHGGEVGVSKNSAGGARFTLSFRRAGAEIARNLMIADD